MMAGPEATGARRLPMQAGALLRRGGRAWQVVFVLLLAVVVYGSLVPPSKEPGFVLPFPDWVQHGVAYAALMLTLLAGQRRPRYWIDAGALLVLGAVIEVLQGWLGYRVADALDLLADAVGIALGAACAMPLLARLKAVHADDAGWA